MIHRLNSWSCMGITRELFGEICRLDSILPEFLSVAHGFRRKTISKDEDFMACYSRVCTSNLSCKPHSLEDNHMPALGQTATTSGGSSPSRALSHARATGKADSLVAFCYNIRYFERHGRALDDPWSCRQSAIHQRLHFQSRRTSSIIIQAPSGLRQILPEKTQTGESHPLEIHLTYMTAGLGSWREYLNYIADKLRQLVGHFLHAFAFRCII